MNSFSISSVISLIFIEIILSIDNLIFISTITTTVDKKYRELTKFIGISIALAMRLTLLFFINSILALDKSFFYIGNMEITYKEFLFIIGGFFLIYKASSEMKKIVMHEEKNQINLSSKVISADSSNLRRFINAVFQIILIDLIFSIDAIIVAIALVPDMKLIVIATLISMATLLISTSFLSKILIKYPSIKLLAMIFIVALGIIFVLQGFEIRVDKSYIHVALLFALIFEIFDIIRLKNLNEK